MNRTVYYHTAGAYNLKMCRIRAYLNMTKNKENILTTAAAEQRVVDDTPPYNLLFVFYNAMEI